MICDRCGVELQVGDFPFCHGSPQDHHGRATSVNGDEIPGGMWQENGFRHPRQFFSKRERDRALAEVGLEIRACNAGPDDKHCPRWATMDPQTLENARVLAERQAHTKATNSPDEDLSVPMTWTVQTIGEA